MNTPGSRMPQSQRYAKSPGEISDTRLCQIPAAVFFGAHGGWGNGMRKFEQQWMTYGTRDLPFLGPICSLPQGETETLKRTGEGPPGAHTDFAYIQVKMSQASVDEPKTSNRIRFELELEFVQALANPYYLHSLAQQGILNQPAFVNYLHYLLYWKEKEYARFVQCVSSTSPEVVIVISHQVPPRPPSSRAATARAVPFRDRQRPVARVLEPEAV